MSNQPRAKRASRRSPEREATDATLYLTRDEMALLAAIARYYERSMRPMGWIIRLTARRVTRSKMHFIREESLWLQRFAVATQADMAKAQSAGARVHLTLPALVGYWGRLLSSTRVRRSRRRLKGEEIRAREDLAEKLAEAVRIQWRRNRRSVEEVIQTRRPLEAGWMHESLTGTDVLMQAEPQVVEPSN